MNDDLARGDRAYVRLFWGCLIAGALLFASLLIWPGCTIAGDPCAPRCPAGHVCAAGRCVPERTVPSPLGPL